MTDSKRKICDMLVADGWHCTGDYLEYVNYQKDDYLVTVLCGYPKPNNRVTSMYLCGHRLEHIMTTAGDTSYEYHEVPFETFLKIALGPTSQIDMRAQNALNERILEDL